MSTRILSPVSRILARAALLLSLAALVTPGSAFAATYGNAPTLFNWVSSAGHTAVPWGGSAQCAAWNSAPVDDDGTAPINIGFNFTFGATVYTQVRIVSNGRLQFGNNYCGYGTQTIGPPPTYPYNYPNTNMNNTIRVYGADFCPAGGGAGCAGTVTYATLGTSPNRSFVVTWNNVREWNSGASLFNVQIVLYENGEFAFQYKDVANMSGGAGQIGYQLSSTDYGLYDTSGIASMAYSAVRFFLPPATWGEYRLDECSGTTAFDNSGNGYDATLINGPTPGSSGALCKGVAFDGTNDYIRLPSGFPNMAASFTITAWIYTTHDWPTGGQKDMRIFTDDENNTGGYSFSLGDGGWDYDSGGIAAGRLRFYNRSLNPVIFDSPPVIRSNTWYFVAAVTDFGANQRFLSVFDAAGNKLSETSQVSTGSWGTDGGRVAIGGEVDGTGEGVAQWRFKGYIDEVKVFKSPLTANQLSGMALNEGSGYGYNGYQRLCVPCTTEIGRFNAFESTTAAGSVNGVIKTKIAGSAFSASSGNLRVVAVNPAGNNIQNISPTVNVTLLDASNDTQPLDSEACRNSWSTIQSLGALALASGTATFNPTVAGAYKNVRLRFDNPGPPVTYGCSTDNFAIRPASLSVVPGDDNWQTAGTTRTLNNATATGGNVHAADRPFTLTATARNAANAVVAGYDSTPNLLPGYMILPSSIDCPTCSIGAFNPGTWSATTPSGTIRTSTATYADVGSFAFSLEDRTFGKVDQGDSTKSQRYIGSAATTVGRFVPDHFDTTVSNACGSFTYSGQVFPLTVTARSGTGATTANYDGSYANSLAKQVTLSDANGSVGTFGPTNPLAANAFVLGVANLTSTPSVKYTFTTKTTAPATLLVRGGDVDTLAQTPAGGAAVEGSVALRSGRLRLSNAYGSDLIDLAVPFETQYWNGSAFVKNTLDGCSTLVPANIVLGNKQGGLAAYTGPIAVSATTAGAGTITLTKPAAAAKGSVDVVAVLGSTGSPSNCGSIAGGTSAALPHLSGKWCGALYDRDPAARAAFGLAGSSAKKGPIYIREGY
jgi:MSHA biogenesis protein MshQ